MSRVGQKEISVPSEVEVTLNGTSLRVKGKLGELETAIFPDILVQIEEQKIRFEARENTKRARELWGLCRANVQNMVSGVSEGFTKRLEIQGVGYRAAVQGKNLKLDLGFSHQVTFPIPAGINIACDKPTSIPITGSNKQHVGQVAAEIRAFRKPEPYKGKGIRYEGEYVRRKEGKKK